MLFPDGWPKDLPLIPENEKWNISKWPVPIDPSMFCGVSTPYHTDWLSHARLFGKPRERDMSEKGLYDKFTVFSTKTGAAIHDTFVLMPERDPAARIALKAYAKAVYTENPTLSRDLQKWTTRIETRLHFKLPDWANVTFEHGVNAVPSRTVRLAIVAGVHRGKTTCGIVAGLRYWEAYVEDKRDGYIVTAHEADKDYIVKFLAEQFDGYVVNAMGVVVVRVNGSDRRIHIIPAADKHRLEGRHDVAWMFFDNIDYMPTGCEFDDAMMYIAPSMMIVSQSKCNFISRMLRRDGWATIIDPSLT